MSLTVLRSFKAPRVERAAHNRGPALFAVNVDMRDGSLRPFLCPTDGPVLENGVRSWCDTYQYRLLLGRLVDSDGKLAAPDQPVQAPETAGAAPATKVLDKLDSHAQTHLVTFCYTVVTHDVNGVPVESGPSPAMDGWIDVGVTDGDITLIIPYSDTSQLRNPRFRVYVSDVVDHDMTEGGEINIKGGDWVLLGETTTGSLTVNAHDWSENNIAGDLLRTSDPYMYPAPADLVALARSEDNIIVADKHRVYVSENGEPLFTAQATVDVEDEIVGIEAFADQVFVLTKGRPVLVKFQSGVNGVNVNRSTINRNLPATGGVSAYGTSVWFISEEGLFQWDTAGYGADVRDITSQTLLPEHWRVIHDADAAGVAVPDGYVAYFPGVDMAYYWRLAGERWEIMPLDFLNMSGQPIYKDGRIHYFDRSGVAKQWAIYHKEVKWCDVPGLPYNGEVGNHVCEEDRFCPYLYEAIIDEEGRSAHTVARVEFDERSSESVQFTILDDYFGERKERATVEVLSSRTFNLPAYRANQTVVLRIEGRATVSEVRLANSRREMVNRSNRAVDT